MKTIVMAHPMHKILQFLFLHSLFFLLQAFARMQH